MRKKIVAILLGVSCLLCGFILAFSSPPEHKRLNSYEQLDALIREHIQLPSAQVSTSTVRVDSNFTRRIYRLRVAPTFSKTTFHYTLHRLLYEYNIKSAAKIYLPEEDMTIHLIYNDTVTGTIKLITDENINSPAASSKNNG